MRGSENINAAAEPTDSEIVNVTLAELSLMLVFVFALLGVSNVDIDEPPPTPPTPPAPADLVLGSLPIGTPPSCLYRPISPGFSGDDVRYVIASGTPSLADLNVFVRNEQPVPTSLLTLKWGIKVDPDQPNGPAGLGDTNTISVVINPARSGPTSETNRNYVFLNGRARSAFDDVMMFLKDEPGSRLSSANVERRINLRDYSKNLDQDGASLGHGGEYETFQKWFVKLNEVVQQEFGCGFYLDAIDLRSDDTLETLRSNGSTLLLSDRVRENLKPYISNIKDLDNRFKEVSNPG